MRQSIDARLLRSLDFAPFDVQNYGSIRGNSSARYLIIKSYQGVLR